METKYVAGFHHCSNQHLRRAEVFGGTARSYNSVTTYDMQHEADVRRPMVALMSRPNRSRSEDRARSDQDFSGLGAGTDRRCCSRVLNGCWLSLSYRGQYEVHRVVWARLVNMSESGAMVQTFLPIKTGSFVRVFGHALLAGNAYIRHCSRRSWGYRIGIEFATSLTERV
jgi:hypothetical protein